MPSILDVHALWIDTSGHHHVRATGGHEAKIYGSACKSTVQKRKYFMVYPTLSVIK